MDTYSVYLVDDEPWALVYLEKIVKWEEMGFRITGKFENSVEAFNRAAAEPADVIFIDIRMPELDGLAFMHKALEAKLPAASWSSAGLRNSAMPRKRSGWEWYMTIA